MTQIAQIRCAIYTRKSSEEGLEQSFNSLDAQREACEAYVLSQRHEGWQISPALYDDGGFSGGNMERPALRRLLLDIAAKRVDTVVVYKVDRLTRSLADFAKIVEQFDKQGISFVSVTQQFNTTTSMGRLTLNVLLSFAQFEREVTGERIRDKIAASKKKGMWMGGVVPVGYELRDRQLVINPDEAKRVNEIYELYLKLGCVSQLKARLESSGILSKVRTSRSGRTTGGATYSRGALYDMLKNRIYLGEITHKGASYPGQHEAIVDRNLWDSVQTQFDANLQAPRKRPRSTSKSLLTGLLYDDLGNRFTPTHASKKGRRYRYYVSQAVIRGSSKRREVSTRLPAEEVEDLVLSAVGGLLGSPQRLLEVLGASSIDPTETQRIIEGSKEWNRVSTDRLRSVVGIVVNRIGIEKGNLKLELNTNTLYQTLTGDSQPEGSEADQSLVIAVKVQWKRFGQEIQFVLPPESGLSKPRTQPSLIRAIARAHDWVDRIVRGDVPSQQAIADHTGLDKRYISRLIQLAFLKPDVVESILDGRQTPHLRLDQCLANIPKRWNLEKLE